MNVLKTAIGQENEILKATDFQFAYSSSIENIGIAIAGIVGPNKNWVLGGKVKASAGLNLTVDPIVLHAGNGLMAFDYDKSIAISIEEPDTALKRVDTVQALIIDETFDKQTRKFNDTERNTQTSQDVDTKTRRILNISVKSGTPGSLIAPDTDSGCVKLAEINVEPGVTFILDGDIINITAKRDSESNEAWTNDKTSVFNISTLADVLNVFLNNHNKDGTFREKTVKSQNLDLGLGNNQIYANLIPVEKSETIRDHILPAKTGITSLFDEIVSNINLLYPYANEILNRYVTIPETVTAATTGNVTLATLQAVDGVSLKEGNIVLVKDQTNKVENGIYVVSDGAWSRHTSYAAESHGLDGKFVPVYEGTVNKRKVFYTDDKKTIGKDEIVFLESIFALKNLPGKAVLYNNKDGHLKVDNPVEDDDVTNKRWVLNNIYPVGSIYWSSKDTNPSALFGGTWAQIKDKFVLAAGDTYKVNNTGGAATVTLATTQIPSHTHTFTGSAVTSAANNRGHTHSVTASGSISGGAYTFTGSAVTSGGNSRGHTHSVTASGSVSGGGYSFTGTAATITGGAHTHSRGTMNITGRTGCVVHNHNDPNAGGLNTDTKKTALYANGSISSHGVHGGYLYANSNYGGSACPLELDASKTWTGSTSSESHSHSYTPAGSVKVTTNPSFTGSAVTSGGESQNHTHSVTAAGTVGVKTNPSFTGSAVTSGGESQNHTHSVTAAGTNGNTGGSQAHENMPPYVVKYCWERTA